MVKFTNQQRLEIIKNYYRGNNRSRKCIDSNEPNQSIPRRSQELCIAQTTLWRIMRKDLGLHAFKIKLT